MCNDEEIAAAGEENTASGDTVTTKISEAEVFAFIQELVHNKSGIDSDKITRESDPKNNLGLDSMDNAEFVLEVEKEYNISIPDEDFDKFTSLGAICACVISLLGERAE
ncbi:MAG: phosphopantetheine-binding protein [Candidatus Falkowbacteria bacterium]|nr:phosphopantetheine-binding protein [Candidatus Falkowbacteria bacterium]